MYKLPQSRYKPRTSDQHVSDNYTDEDDIILLLTKPTQSLKTQTQRVLDEEEECDIERYAGLIRKASTETEGTVPKTRRHLNLASQDQHQAQIGPSGAFIALPSTCGDAQTSHGDNSICPNKVAGQFQEQEAPETFGRRIPSFKSIKSNIMKRLLGSQPLAGSRKAPFGYSDPSTSNDCLGMEGCQTEDVNGKMAPPPLSSSTDPNAIRPSSSAPTARGEHVAGMTQNFSLQRSQPNRTGGVLSNLLKIQALSMPPSSSSRRHRKRHAKHHHRRDPARQQNARKASVAFEALPISTSRSLLSSPNASVLSLPGTTITTPSGGLGLKANAASPSIAVANPRQTGECNSMNEYKTQTERLADDTPRNTAPMSPNVTSLAPHRLRTMASKYLQTCQEFSDRSSVSADDSTSVYSGISQDPLVAALRLDQQVQLTEAVVEMLQCQNLLIRLCKSFIRYGAPSHRIELAMEALCKTFGVDGSFAFLPGLMMISFGDSDTHTSETHLIKCAQGFDMGRLAKVHKIARSVVYGQMQAEEALASLKAINGEKQLYNMWVMLMAYAVSSGLIAPLVFNGSWYDMLASMGLGSVVGLTNLLASRYSVYSDVFEVSTSIVVAFLAKALRDYVCFTGVVLSAIVMLLPGLSLTTAIMELSSRYMISGSVRMFYSLIYCLFLGFGLSIGSNLWDVFKAPPPGDQETGYCHPATEPWRWVLFPLLAIAFNVQLHALPRQWPVMVICSSVGYAVSEFAGLYWPHTLHIAAAVSAFVVGLLGNLYERLTHELAFVPILGAILLIVPGGMGVRSSLLLLEQSGNASQGTEFALQMIVVALGIAVGLFASTLVVYPLGKKRNALLTF
ncbi:hypothetical protein BGX28_009793 [Mortierella sp. GBA30]|nr:hypothetical protein BGX28_009793 [Mortierella sp. GBA30]